MSVAAQDWQGDFCIQPGNSHGCGRDTRYALLARPYLYVLNYDTRVFIRRVLNYDTRECIRRILNYDTRVFIRYYDTYLFIEF